MHFLANHLIEVLIVIWAVVVGVFFYFTFKLARELRDDLSPRERKANPSEKKNVPETPEELREYENMIVAKRDRMNLVYSLFANFTSVLPLWGMFGTVVSLIGLAGNMSDSDIPVDQFFTALYTTALGIIFAILYKALDSVVSVKVAANNKEADILLDRNSERKRQEGGKS